MMRHVAIGRFRDQEIAPIRTAAVPVVGSPHAVAPTHEVLL